MKRLIPFITLCLLSGCASQHEDPTGADSAAVKSSPSYHDQPSVRTTETVKAYPAGRYTDPNYPEAMHERHTVYRRERSTDWNYLPDAPMNLPLGPTIAASNPSASYYVKTDRDQRNAQQRAYAKALQEQNSALKKRIQKLEQSGENAEDLKAEIERLKTELQLLPVILPPEPDPDEPPAEEPVPWDSFSAATTKNAPFARLSSRPIESKITSITQTKP